MNAQKVAPLLALLVVSFANGMAHQYFVPESALAALDLLFMLIAGFVVFFWYVADAREKEYGRSWLLGVVIVVIPVLALPYYFFRSRRLPASLLATLAMLLLLLLYAVVQYVGMLATWSLWQS